MNNVKLEQQGNFLVIKIDVTERNGKTSGGNTSVASTKGNKTLLIGDVELTVGLNAFIKDAPK
jgi:hypothetical protein